MGNNFFQALIERIAVHHDHIPTSKTLNLNVSAETQDLKSFRTR